VIGRFPVASDGHPHFSDDFSYVKPGHVKPHGGIDIYADMGTRVLAPDDGDVRFTEDPIGGHVFYLKSSNDGTTYYGAHLSAFEGTDRTVIFGDVIGYVGDSGNAQGASPHLHFEEHPQGSTSSVDPFKELQHLDPYAARGVANPAAAPASSGLGFEAKALLAAYEQAHGAPAPASIAWPMAQAIGEGSFSDAFKGSNNWGASDAGVQFEKTHAADKGYGLLAFMDRNQAGFYIAKKAILPSPLLGAARFLATVEHAMDLTTVASVDDYAHALYLTGYYTGWHGPVTPLASRKAADAAGQLNEADKANIASYAHMTSLHLPLATSAIAAAAGVTRDPSVNTVGPPFASLEQRLTPGPGNAPHTLEHAREMLGEHADHPWGGTFSLDEALDAPNGPGVWLFATAPARKANLVARVLDEHPVGAGAVLAGVVTFGVAALGAIAAAHVAPVHIRRRRAA
jgi:hypothetical protein